MEERGALGRALILRKRNLKMEKKKAVGEFPCRFLLRYLGGGGNCVEMPCSGMEIVPVHNLRYFMGCSFCIAEKEGLVR